MKQLFVIYNLVHSKIFIKIINCNIFNPRFLWQNMQKYNIMFALITLKTLPELQGITMSLKYNYGYPFWKVYFLWFAINYKIILRNENLPM